MLSASFLLFMKSKTQKEMVFLLLWSHMLLKACLLGILDPVKLTKLTVTGVLT